MTVPVRTLTQDLIESYHDSIEKEVKRCYSLAKEIRELGRDVTNRVEIPLASDMADRIEELIGLVGIAVKIRELSRSLSREEVAINISRDVAKEIGSRDKKEAVDKAIRVGLAILTEGILVAPLEGIADVNISRENDSDYLSVVYSGPIRGAGGTAQAMSVLIADIVRRDLGIGSFRISEDEIERYTEEIQAYNRVKHLQYLPTPEEIRQIVKNCPVMIDGEGSEEQEVSGHRDMSRIKTNRIRGGMCLVICEGLVQKSKKVLKYTSSLGLTEWDFLSNLHGPDEKGDASTEKSEKFLKDIIAGRPVFSHPGRPGGFRLRYGRSRITGLAAAGINPVTMYVLDSFIAIGSQIKIELPGKAAAITPCDYIDGPMVVLKDGSNIRVRSIDHARHIMNEVVKISDIGEILISYGEFLENNHRLEVPPFVHEWWYLYAEKFPELRQYEEKEPDEIAAIQIARKYGIPLHPRFDYLWHDITAHEINYLRKKLENAVPFDGKIRVEFDQTAANLLMDINKEYNVENGFIVMDEYMALFASLGLDQNSPVNKDIADETDPVEAVCMLSGMKIMPRSPTRIGARMGRPEKSGDRKMKPKVHVLFPVENYGNTRRSLISAEKTVGGTFEIECLPRICPKCGTKTPEPLCENCGSITEPMKNSEKIKIDFGTIMATVMERVRINSTDLTELKGVKKLMSSRKVCEPVEKGILRSLHDISINKDGTCRYDISDIPISHFLPEEIGLDRPKAESLGYSADVYNEIYVQDIIVPRKAATYLLKVSKFIDDLLVRYYNKPPFYDCKNEEDLIGHLVIGLAPHTSGGIVGRIIGFTDVSGCYAHPFFHAAKRRNCDGDEDSIMLLMDGFLNFSKEFLPSTRGGLMDAPLVLTVKLNPDEVDKEAMNVDTLTRYPIEFYEAAEKLAMPTEIEHIMKPMKAYIKDHGTYAGFGFSIPADHIDSGVTISSYKTIVTMEEKIERQLGLATRIRAVDENDVAARVLSSHFLPDIYGNFRGFFSQSFRCTKCNAKYRRIPLSGRCTRCGGKSIILTVHKGGIVKYLDETIKISREYRIPDYLKARIENLEKTIRETFADDRDETPEEDHDEVDSALESYEMNNE
ncbi:MAG: DNA polymerase II large subunit [Thermoplasmataceae archaeon]